MAGNDFLMQFRNAHFWFAAVAVAIGCSQSSPQAITTADVKEAFAEQAELLSRMVQFIQEDNMEMDYGLYVGVMQPNPTSRPAALLKVLRDKGLPVTDVIYDKTDGQLTVHFLVEDWNSMRLVYTDGHKPREILLTCNECPKQLLEPISDGWFVGIIDDSNLSKSE